MKLHREEQMQEILLLRKRNECPATIRSSNARILKYELDLKCKFTLERGREKNIYIRYISETHTKSNAPFSAYLIRNVKMS